MTESLYMVFSIVFYMSVTAGIAILAVLAIRFLLRKAPKLFSYMLWSIVLFRLLCPIALPSSFSVLNLLHLPMANDVGLAYISDAKTPTAYPFTAPDAGNGPDAFRNVADADNAPVTGNAPDAGNAPITGNAPDAGNTPVTGNTPDAATHTADSDKRSGYAAHTAKTSVSHRAANADAGTKQIANSGQKDAPRTGSTGFAIPIMAFAHIWLIGIAVFMLSGIFAIRRLRKQTACSMPLRNNIYLTDGIAVPFVFGLLHPRIYLPSALPENERAYIILHEQHHILRRDYIFKALAFICLCLHWFNPLVWLAYFLSVKDMEMSCDEAVIRKIGRDARAEYAALLLHLSTGRHIRVGIPLAFGEGNPKGRIKNVMRYKKPPFWAFLGMIAVCAIGAACLLTNPSKDYAKQGSSAGDKAGSQKTVTVAGTHTFQARVTGIIGDSTKLIPEYEDGILVKAAEGTAEIGVSDEINIPQEALPTTLEPALGDIVAIQYNGEITESSPARLGEIYRVNLVEKASENPGEKDSAEPEQINAETGSEKPEQTNAEASSAESEQANAEAGSEKPEQTNAEANSTESEQTNAEASSAESEQTNAEANSVESEQTNAEAAAGQTGEKPDPADNETNSMQINENPEKPDIAYQSQELTSEASIEKDNRAAITNAILSHNRDSYSQDYDYECCSFVELDAKTKEKPLSNDVRSVTYYGWALYEQYKFSDKGIEEVGGSHIPVALTFKLDRENGKIIGTRPDEYWTPRGGSYYSKDIRKKFPAAIADDGIDSQKYIMQQVQDCYAQAVAYAGLDTDSIIENLIQTICSDTQTGSSNPQDYIHAHDIEYRELCYYGDSTIRYCLERFAKKPETGLEGHIMARVCEELLGTKGKIPADASSTATGQEWYNTLKAHAGNIIEKYLPQVEKKALSAPGNSTALAERPA